MHKPNMLHSPDLGFALQVLSGMQEYILHCHLYVISPENLVTTDRGWSQDKVVLVSSLILMNH